MECISGAGVGVAELMPQATLATTRALLDVGGGTGTNSIALCRRFPALTATVWDLPSVCRRARKVVQAAALQPRIGTVTGNFLKDPVPKGHDAVLFSHISNIYSGEANTQMLRRCLEALPSHGQVLLYNSAASDAEDGPLSPALLSAYFLTLATGEGMVYPVRDVVGWLDTAGFVGIEVHRAPRGNSALVVGRVP
jgi:hypothetical protein